MRRLAAVMLVLLAAGCGGPVAKWSGQLKSPDAAAREEAARKLSELGPQALPAVPALIDALGDSSKDVQRLAAYALRQIGPPASDAVPALERTLGDTDSEVRLAAAYALMAVEPDNAKPLQVLIEAVRQGDARAIVAVGEMGPAAKEAIPALAQAMSNRAVVVRVQIVKALARIDRTDPTVQATLAKAKSDPEERVRKEAVAALK